MNAGAYGNETSKLLTKIKLLDSKDGKLKKLNLRLHNAV